MRINQFIDTMALTGFCLGGLGSSMYLLRGGSYFFNAADWAIIVFYPGFLAGFQAYGWGVPEDYAKLIGIIAVGMTYGFVAIVMRFAWLGVHSLKPGHTIASGGSIGGRSS